MSPRLQKFLDAIEAAGFYGEVTIRFRSGRVAGPVRVEQEFLEETLPEALPVAPKPPARPPLPSRPSSKRSSWLQCQ